MPAPEKDPGVHGPFLVQGELARGGEVTVACREADKDSVFGYWFFDRSGRPIGSVKLHRVPPAAAYIPIPPDAGALVLRSPTQKIVIPIP